MNFDVEKRTIYRVKHGSHAYGLNIESSDVDEKGVCIEPIEYHFGFLHNFEQQELLVSKGHEKDVTIYSLKKFVKLASDCNPNIIEILFVDDCDVLFCDEFGEMLRNERQSFLSRKARHTFSGYAISQLKRIKSHRNWLLNPPKNEPNRKDFSLGETTKVSRSELGAFEQLVKSGVEVELPKDVLNLFLREKQYQVAKSTYDQYVNWVKTRNPVRSELEKKHFFDTKHGMHLIRLMRMCKEILQTGKVNVKRHDREELLAIRNGMMSYDELIDSAEKLEKECELLYETSCLPNSPNRNKLDKLIVDMTQKYLKLHD